MDKFKIAAAVALCSGRSTYHQESEMGKGRTLCSLLWVSKHREVSGM